MTFQGARVSIDQTADGWEVSAHETDHVFVTTQGDEITVSIIPDATQPEAKPLDVSLAG